MLSTIIGTAIGLEACNLLVTRFLPPQTHHDYTVSQIISAGFQIYLIGISVYMMYIQSTSTFLYGIMVGYLLYDLVNLLRKPFGRTMYVIQGHHVATMVFMGHIYLFTTYDYLMYPMVLVILESSSLVLNGVGLLKQIIRPMYHKAIHLANVVLYGISRVLLFPLWIYWFGRHHLMSGTFDIPNGITLVICIAANGIFALWWYKLILKYLNK